MKSSNGIELERPVLADCKVKKSITLEGVRRNPSGTWSADLVVDISVTLPDGRVVKINAPVAIQGRQWGRKPRAK